VDRRLRQARTLLQHSLRLREEAQAQVAAAADELGERQREGEATRRALEGLRANGPASTAAAAVARDEYAEALRVREGELARLTEEAAQRLPERRRVLRRTWREAQVWEKLAARLERAEARWVARSEQELIDRQSRRSEGLGEWDLPELRETGQ
jgi:hypothetical protein